jgi:anti-sigma28 factor (negative regulator of flagellin synthesis)
MEERMNITNNVSTQRSEVNTASSAAETKAVSQAATTAANTKAANTKAADQANISSASGAISAALNVSDVRQEKVGPIQAAIQARTYNIPSGAVADKIISSLIK